MDGAQIALILWFFLAGICICFWRSLDTAPVFVAHTYPVNPKSCAVDQVRLDLSSAKQFLCALLCDGLPSAKRAHGDNPVATAVIKQDIVVKNRQYAKLLYERESAIRVVFEIDITVWRKYGVLPMRGIHYDTEVDNDDDAYVNLNQNDVQ